MSIEIWKPVVGHECDYEVSDQGRVRSLDRVKTYARLDQYSGRELTIQRKHKGRLLRPGPSHSGHLSVVLGREAGSRPVHQLVLEAFVGPCPDGHESCHHDDNPINNVLENLRWGTRSDNLLDAVRNGKKRTGERHQGAKLKETDVLEIRRRCDGNWGSISNLARELNVKESTVRQVRDRLSWKHIP